MLRKTEINKKEKEKKERADRTLGQMVKAKLYRQVTQRSTHIHTHKKRKRKKNIYIYLYIMKKKRKRTTESINKSTNDNKL